MSSTAPANARSGPTLAIAAVIAGLLWLLLSGGATSLALRSARTRKAAQPDTASQA